MTKPTLVVTGKMLHFTRHFTFRKILMILMSFCSTFIRVYV